MARHEQHFSGRAEVSLARGPKTGPIIGSEMTHDSKDVGKFEQGPNKLNLPFKFDIDELRRRTSRN